MAPIYLSFARILGHNGPIGASWQWDRIWADGARYKSGYSGQGLYVDERRGLVVAWFGTGEDYNETRHQLVSATRQMVTAGIFGDAASDAGN